LNKYLQTVSQAWSIKRNLRTLFVRENDRWAFLDGYRAIGIFWVILGHCIVSTQSRFGMEKWGQLVSDAPVFLQWVFNGDVAVDGFLMVSGFLMANILMKQYQEHGRLNVKVFYLSRFLRLTPAYFFALTLFVTFSNSAHLNVWPNYFYIQNFFNDYDAYLMPYTWSLAVEEQFYLLLPAYLVFVLVKTKHPFLHLSALLVGSLAIRAWVILDDEILRNETIKGIIFNEDNFKHYFVILYDNLYTRFGAFIGGIAVAYAYRYRPEQSRRFLETQTAFFTTIAAMLIALSLCFLPVLMDGFELPQWVNISLNVGRRTVVCLCAAWLLFCGLFSNHLAKRFNNAMSHKFFYPFGHLLYSMYLFHYMAIALVMGNLSYNFKIYNIDYMANLEAWLFLAAILSIFTASIIATFTYLFIEAPIMNLRPKLSR
jgi:peptidoglycan/LPS O-acetylase OafA/YrhL